MKPSLKKVVLLFLIFLWSFNLVAQDLTDDLKTWMGYSLGVKIGKRFKVKIGQLYSVDVTTYRFGFAQSDFSASYKLAPRNYLELEYSNSQYRWFTRLEELGFSQNLLGLVDFQRFTLTYNVSHRLFKKNRLFKLKHYVSAQVFFPQPVKHRVRFVYTTRLYYSNPKWPLKIRPYLANTLHYYLGGRPIAYHDEQGSIVAYNSPDGFHRIRIKTGSSFAPVKTIPLTVTFYIIFQWEFNNNIFPNRGLNYTKPAPLDNINYPFEPLSVQTQLPFNNYITIGLHLSYTLKIKIKKKKNAKRN